MQAILHEFQNSIAASKSMFHSVVKLIWPCAVHFACLLVERSEVPSPAVPNPRERRHWNLTQCAWPFRPLSPPSLGRKDFSVHSLTPCFSALFLVL